VPIAAALVFTVDEFLVRIPMPIVFMNDDARLVGKSYVSWTCQQVLPWHTMAADALKVDVMTTTALIAAAERVFPSIF
jgi:hypothetical protein